MLSVDGLRKWCSNPIAPITFSTFSKISSIKRYVVCVKTPTKVKKKKLYFIRIITMTTMMTSRNLKNEYRRRPQESYYADGISGAGVVTIRIVIRPIVSVYVDVVGATAIVKNKCLFNIKESRRRVQNAARIQYDRNYAFVSKI